MKLKNSMMRYNLGIFQLLYMIKVKYIHYQKIIIMQKNIKIINHKNIIHKKIPKKKKSNDYLFICNK